MKAPPAERAADVSAASADPDIKAVIAGIGGEDELEVLAHLDPGALAASPKKGVPEIGVLGITPGHLWTGCEFAGG